MRYALLTPVAAIPAALWAAVLTAPPQRPVEVKPVITEGVREAKMDSGTFRARWASVVDLPPATVIRVREVVARTDDLPPVVISKPTLKKTTRRASLRRPDVCQRHKMHKVTIGRRWRCRR
jgi:hypothetical protein